MGRWGGERKGEREEPGAAVGRSKVQQGRATNMSALFREEPLEKGQPRPWAVEFRAEGEMYKPYPVTGRG